MRNIGTDTYWIIKELFTAESAEDAEKIEMGQKSKNTGTRMAAESSREITTLWFELSL